MCEQKNDNFVLYDRDIENIKPIEGINIDIVMDAHIQLLRLLDGEKIIRRKLLKRMVTKEQKSVKIYMRIVDTYRVIIEYIKVGEMEMAKELALKEKLTI